MGGKKQKEELHVSTEAAETGGSKRSADLKGVCLDFSHDWKIEDMWVNQKQKTEEFLERKTQAKRTAPLSTPAQHDTSPPPDLPSLHSARFQTSPAVFYQLDIKFPMSFH